MEDAVQYPDYKQAVSDFLNEKFEPGTIITHEWLDEHLRISKRDPNYGFKKMNRIANFRETLLVEHKIHLQNIRGKGYSVLPPADQTPQAMSDAMRVIGTTLVKTTTRLMNVDVNKLSDAERIKNDEAILRIAALRGMTKKRITD